MQSKESANRSRDEGVQDGLRVFSGEQTTKDHSQTGKSEVERKVFIHSEARLGCIENIATANSPGIASSDHILGQRESSSGASVSRCRSPLAGIPSTGPKIKESETNVLTETPEPLSPLTELSSDSFEEASEKSAPATSDGSGSCDATSSEFSAPRKSPVLPRLFMDCVIPPPFYIPKKLFRPMIEVYPDMVSNADDGSNSESFESEEVPSWRARGKKRKRNRSRSHSPLHSYTEEQALEIFGQNMSMYSVCGPPGGYLIGVGTLQCCPEDNGRASFNFEMDGAQLRRLAEGTQQARDDLLTSNSSRTSRPKPQKAKSKSANTPKKPSNKNKSKEGPTQASSCHLCARKTTIPKMTCSGLSLNGTRCRARFCEGCVQRKFPDLRFDSGDLNFICPRCAGYCPCAACSRKKEKDGPDSKLAVSKGKKVAAPAVAYSRAAQSRQTPKFPRKTVTNRKSATHKCTANYNCEGDNPIRESVLEDDFVSVGSGNDIDSLPACSADPATRRTQGSRLVLEGTPKRDRELCHQCRARNNYAKMRCTNKLEDGRTCDTHYCHKCITFRYPDIVFDANGIFTCFKCKNVCNCDRCRRDRGEKYSKSSSVESGEPSISKVNLPMAQSRSGRAIKRSERARYLENEDNSDAEHAQSRPRKRRRSAASTSATDNVSTSSSRAMSKSAVDHPPPVILSSPLSEAPSLDQ
ncbi:hypothetical protein ACEPAH_20 [Sanghuangporus vaninii]